MSAGLREHLTEAIVEHLVSRFGDALDQGTVSWKALQAAIKDVLVADFGEMASLDEVASLIVPVFIPLPEDFDPKALLAKVSDETFDRIMLRLDEDGDGNTGTFPWFTAERAWRKGLCEKPWGFKRLSGRKGETYVYLKGRPEMTATITFGE